MTDRVTKRTRKRTPTSCTVCRTKKVKCDKKRPVCGGCVAGNTQSLCEFQVQGWVQKICDERNCLPVVSQSSEIERLNRKILELESVIRTSMEPDTSSEKTAIPSPVISSEALESPRLVVERAAKQFAIKNLKIYHFGPTSYMYLLLNGENAPEAFSKTGEELVRNFRSKMTSIERQNDQLYQSSIPTVFDCSKGPGKRTELLKFPSLPPVKVINFLVRRFFRLCFVFAPFLDEKSLMDEIGHLFIKGPIIDPAELIYNRSTVAILLITLRFAYLTTSVGRAGSDDTISVEFQKYISGSGGISVEFIEYAKHLILGTEIFEKSDFRKLQAIMLLRVYQLHCPEYEIRSTNSPNTLMAIAVQIARFLGINANPDDFSIIPLSSSDNHLWKKTWSTLKYYDAALAFDGGLPLLILDFEDEQKEPYSDLETNGLWLSSQELKLAKLFEIRSVVTRLLRKLVKLLNYGRIDVSAAYVKKLLGELSEVLEKNIRPFDVICDQSKSHSEFADVDELLLRITTEHMYFTLCYMLSRHGTTKDLRWKYLTLATSSGLKMFKLGLDFSLDLSLICPAELLGLVAPYIWHMLKVVSIFFADLLLKGLKNQLSMSSVFSNFQPEDTEWLGVAVDSDGQLLLKLVEKFSLFYETLKALSVRYYHCYHLCFIFKITLEYYREQFPEYVPQEKRLGQSSLPLVTFWYTNVMNLNYSYEQFLDHLQLNSDPFLNEMVTI